MVGDRITGLTSCMSSGPDFSSEKLPIIEPLPPKNWLPEEGIIIIIIVVWQI